MHRHIAKTIRHGRQHEKCSRTHNSWENTPFFVYKMEVWDHVLWKGKHRWHCCSNKSTFNKPTVFCTAYLHSPWFFLSTLHWWPTCIQLPSYLIPTSHCRPLSGQVRLKGSRRWKLISSEFCWLLVLSIPHKTGTEEGRVQSTTSPSPGLSSLARASPAASTWAGKVRSSKDSPRNLCDSLGHILGIITWLQVCKNITRNH